MAVYMIGYDLHPKQGETYDELINAIKNVGTHWWHCLDSTWLVSTHKTAEQIYFEIAKHMYKDDQLLVIKYGGPDAAWGGFDDGCSQWLRDNL